MRDVIIVGAGLAGLVCAWRIGEASPRTRVLVQEGGVPGGSSALAVGSFTAAGTSLQRAAGVVDTPAEHHEDLLRMVELEGTTEDQERYRSLLRRFCEAAPEAWERLRAAGASFSGPYLEPPHRKPRMHNAVPAARAVVELALERVGRLPGVELAAGHPVTALGRDGAGFQVASGLGLERCGALVVACGDRSAAWDRLPGLNPAALGAPIDLAGVAFGARRHPARYHPGLRTVVPGQPHVEPQRQLVEAAVARTPSGEVPGRELLATLPEHAGEELFLIVEDPSSWWDRMVCTYPAVGYATLRGLVEAGQAAEEGDRVVVGPLRAVITLADGALDVDGSAAVLSESLAPVPGLFACGSAALGAIQLHGHGHHLMWCAVSGGWAAASALAALS
jgi:succinate dehydrogenase/fumarate reductase flavoprotein subunit